MDKGEKHFNEVISFHVNCEKRFFKCFKMQMVINLAPVSLSNLSTLAEDWIDFSEETFHRKCLQEHF